MKKIISLLIAFAMLILAAPPNPVQSQSRNPKPPPRVGAAQTKFHKVKDAAPNQYIVMLREDTPRARVSQLASELARAHGGTLEYIYSSVFKGFSVKNMAEAQAVALSKNSLVTRVEESARIQLTGQQPFPEEQGVIKPLDRIDQRSGLDGFYTYPRTGTGVHVYIVDTGVWIKHNEFGGRAYALWDFQPGTSIGGYATGNDNHGTLTASAVGAKTYGVAKNCLLYSVRVASFASGTGTISDAIQGLQQILNDVQSKNKRPAVVNMSIIFNRTASGVSTLETTVTSLINSGITVVTGAGNGNNDASNFSPGRMARVITIGATTGIPGPSLDARASYSSFGAAVDAYAPGGDSGWFARNAGHNTTYGIDGNQGTSIASPLGAGSVALYLEQFSLDTGNFNAQPDQVQTALKNSRSGLILYMGCEFISPPASNPIDDTRIFIRQHYYDFLNRQPDQAGWDFWVNTIESCGGDAGCREVKRINGSRAFFESIEFHGTGYYVYRVNKISFSTFAREDGFVGPNPRMEQFFVDQQTVGNGVIVGQPGWEQTMDANQTNFANEWVNRPRFLAEYPLSMSSAEFVDKLYATAGVSDPAMRDAMINGLNNGTETRATVVKKIALSGAVGSNQQLFYNPAYVLMQYFGYLRRNPDDAPDGNLSGYNFWLNELNSGRKNSFEMVQAFISSIEYRERFFKAPFCTAEPPPPPPPMEEPPWDGGGGGLYGIN